MTVLSYESKTRPTDLLLQKKEKIFLDSLASTKSKEQDEHLFH